MGVQDWKAFNPLWIHRNLHFLPLLVSLFARWPLSIWLKWAACWVCGSSSSVTPCYWDHWSWASSWPRSSWDAARFVSLSHTRFPARQVVCWLTGTLIEVISRDNADSHLEFFYAAPHFHTFFPTNEWALLYFSNQKIKITIQNGARGNALTCRVIISPRLLNLKYSISANPGKWSGATDRLFIFLRIKWIIQRRRKSSVRLTFD